MWHYFIPMISLDIFFQIQPEEKSKRPCYSLEVHFSQHENSLQTAQSLVANKRHTEKFL